MPEQGLLRVHGHGKVEVEQVTAWLTDLKYAYDSIALFMIADALGRPPIPLFFVTSSPEQLASFVPLADRLLLNAVELKSPGCWEFLGTLNPLEVIRNYLNDRHERRKDREYRESAEARRLQLENLSLENNVLRERIELLKKMGASDSDLAPLRNKLLYVPLSNLDQYQAKGIIEGAEVVKISDQAA